MAAQVPHERGHASAILLSRSASVGSRDSHTAENVEEHDMDKTLQPTQDEGHPASVHGHGPSSVQFIQHVTMQQERFSLATRMYVGALFGSVNAASTISLSKKRY